MSAARDTVTARLYFDDEPVGDNRSLLVIPGSVSSLANSIRRNLPTAPGWGFRLAMAADVAERLGVYETADGDHAIRHPYLTTTGIKVRS